MANNNYRDPYEDDEETTASDTYSQNTDATQPKKFTYSEYQSNGQKALDKAMNKILNRGKFTYDVTGDALYQQYKDQYVNQGRMAMMDTMGQASALTGGYGSSYASTAGNQAYQGYLQQLNDKVPELYKLALDKYNQEGQDLYNQYALLADRESTEYDRYLDGYDRAYTQYQDSIKNEQWERGQDHLEEQDAIENEQWQAEMDYQADRDEKEDEQWGITTAWQQAAAAAEMGDYSLYESLGLDTSTIKDERQFAKDMEEAAAAAAMGDYSKYEALGFDVSKIMAKEQRATAFEEAAVAASMGDYSKYEALGFNVDIIMETEDYEKKLREAETAAMLGDYSKYEKLGFDITKIQEAEAKEEAVFKATIGDYSGYEELGYDVSNVGSSEYQLSAKEWNDISARCDEYITNNDSSGLKNYLQGLYNRGYITEDEYADFYERFVPILQSDKGGPWTGTNTEISMMK